MKKKYDISNFLDKLNSYSRDLPSLLRIIETNAVEQKQLQTIFTPNPEQLVLASEDQSFDKVLRQADILIPDGIGLVIASRLFSLVGKGVPLARRIPGVDVVKKILNQAKKEKHTVIVIGGKAYNNLAYREWHIELLDGSRDPKRPLLPQVLYWLPAYEKAARPTATEEALVTSLLRQFRPTIVFVALGAPEQEKWVIAHQQLLRDSGVVLAMVVGGAFDMLLGKLARAPKYIRAMGLEWAFRLVQEPWRWRRQLKLVVFIKLVLQSLLRA